MTKQLLTEKEQIIINGVAKALAINLTVPNIIHLLNLVSAIKNETLAGTKHYTIDDKEIPVSDPPRIEELVMIIRHINDDNYYYSFACQDCNRIIKHRMVIGKRICHICKGIYS